jgi:hypothetical protein
MFENEKDHRLPPHHAQKSKTARAGDPGEAQLDSLLSAYSAVEPRPGLETRIRASLRARVEHRRQQWMWTFAAAAAAIALIAFIGIHTRPSSAPNYAIAPKPSPATSLAHSETSPAPAPVVMVRLGVTRHAKPGKPNNSSLLLQMANASQGESAIVFQEAKLYISPETQSAEVQEEPQPKVESPNAAPGISIQSLGTKPVEMKDLVPANDISN